MKKIIVTFLGPAVLLLVLPIPAKADGFKAGQWNMTMTSKMEKMPPEMAAKIEKIRMEMEKMSPDQKSKIDQLQQKLGVSNLNVTNKGQTFSMSKCLTKPLGYLITPQQEKYCQQSHEMIGNTVHFHTSCKSNEWEAEYTGKITYSGESMLGQMRSHVVEGGKTMDATIDITGKFAGPCS